MEEKANHIAVLLGKPDVQSHKWFAGCTGRNYETESNSRRPTTKEKMRYAEWWSSTVLTKLLERYEPCTVYNERTEPCQTVHSLSTDTLSGRERAKDCITALVADEYG